MCPDEGGGDAIFVRSGNACEELGYLVELFIHQICEIAATFIPERNVVCLEIHCTPNYSNFNSFIDEVSNVLCILSSRNKSNASVMMSGDCYVNIFNCDLKKSVFMNLLLSFNLSALISYVTRANLVNKGKCSCVDNIATTTVHFERGASVVVETMIVNRLNHNCCFMGQ